MINWIQLSIQWAWGSLRVNEFLFFVYLLGFSDSYFSDGLFLFLLNPCTAQVLDVEARSSLYAVGLAAFVTSFPNPSWLREQAATPGCSVIQPGLSADWPLSFSLVIWGVEVAFSTVKEVKRSFQKVIKKETFSDNWANSCWISAAWKGDILNAKLRQGGVP